MKFVLYLLASALLFGISVILCLYNSPNVYAATIMISQSPLHITIGLNVIMCLFFAVAHVLKTILFGTLQSFEVEHLYEQFWFTFAETCIAAVLFRETFGFIFFFLLSVFTLARVFHSICAFRTERTQIQFADHDWRMFSRMIFTYVTLFLLDVSIIYVCVSRTFKAHPQLSMMFLCEFLVLLIDLFTSVAKFWLHGIEARQPNQVWESKPIYVFRVEVIRDATRLAVYLFLFFFMFSYQSLPLYTLRQIYICTFSLVRRCKEHLRYRQATRNMDAMYPDATEEQLNSSDRTCTICREEMFRRDHPPAETDDVDSPPPGLNMTPKRLPCGHILHLNCLRNWLERQQTCPVCRRPVLNNDSRHTGKQTGLLVVPEGTAAAGAANADANGGNGGGCIQTPSSSTMVVEHGHIRYTDPRAGTLELPDLLPLQMERNNVVRSATANTISDTELRERFHELVELNEDMRVRLQRFSTLLAQRGSVADALQEPNEAASSSASSSAIENVDDGALPAHSAMHGPSSSSPLANLPKV
ncbi:synviolin family ubiquitin-protein ligase Hrd1 [Schizosaccharomyces japonicus yFS275]|uniref:RING-type E3 ubiquitin transferase n=1 Tax=Schizosaccharomyces japonicus (strain yFS275 / FY16936) TaxID=402676 RepID=B6K0S2_SCHJY|nr:synviolin family ubiquitin-protein ligase Hrd1 [Schizosaccharomyces japonicus yFS275]EEB07543.2 synviolin family ubiquitin-protein ligase Hrd1 [Schizosaccharomyces japonicus yFS275]